MRGFLCPISSVKGHVPRVLTLVTSLTSSLPGDLGPGVFITNPHPGFPPPPPPPNAALPMEENKTPPSLSPSHSCTNWLHIHMLAQASVVYSFLKCPYVNNHQNPKQEFAFIEKRNPTSLFSSDRSQVAREPNRGARACFARPG